MFKRIMKNACYLSFSQVLNKLFFLLLTVLIVKYLGKIGLGNYTFIFVFAEMIFVISDFGLNNLIIRTLSRNRRLKNKLFINIVMLRLFFSLISIVILIIITKLVVHAQLIEKSLAIPIYWICLAYSVHTQTLNLISYFEAFQKMEYEIYIYVIRDFIQVFLSVIFLATGKGLLHLVIAFNIGVIVSFLIGVIILLKKVTRISLNVDIPLCFRLARTGFSFFLSKVLDRIILRTDILMLKMICGAGITGLYSAAWAIVKNMMVVTDTFSIAVYPQMSIVFKKSKNKAVEFYNKSKNIILSFVIVLFLLIALFAKQIIVLLYGNDFYDSILVLRLLSLVGPFAILTWMNTAYLFSINKQNTVIWIKGFICALNILLSFIFISKHGLFGAVIATVVTFIIYFFITSYMVFSYNKSFLKFSRKLSLVAKSKSLH